MSLRGPLGRVPFGRGPLGRVPLGRGPAERRYGYLRGKPRPSRVISVIRNQSVRAARMTIIIRWAAPRRVRFDCDRPTGRAADLTRPPSVRARTHTGAVQLLFRSDRLINNNDLYRFACRTQYNIFIIIARINIYIFIL